jgi:predicted small integral membrane protein
MSLNDRKSNVIQDNANWQMRVIVVGGVIGAMLGLMTSWLLVRTSRETRGGPPAITTGDALKVGITAIGLIRSIAALGDKS